MYKLIIAESLIHIYPAMRTKRSQSGENQAKRISVLKSQIIESQTQCPICLEEYDLLKKIPMMICLNQHSTCAKCLANVYKLKKCPVCCDNLIRRPDVRKNRLNCYFLQEMFRGNGQILIHSKTYTYKGEAKNGKRHGMGELLTKDGNFMKGKFQNGQIVGKCEVTTKNGAKFIGQAIDGRLIGTFNTKYGSAIQGNFSMDSLSGPNCTKKYTNGDIYVGMISKLKANGFGKLTFTNGNVFEGQFEKDYIRGEGSATITGTFQVDINRGQAYIKQIGQQIKMSSGNIQGSGSDSNSNSDSNSESDFSPQSFISQHQ